MSCETPLHLALCPALLLSVCLGSGLPHSISTILKLSTKRLNRIISSWKKSILDWFDRTPSLARNTLEKACVWWFLVVVAGAFGFPRKQVSPESFSTIQTLHPANTLLVAIRSHFSARQWLGFRRMRPLTGIGRHCFKEFTTQLPWAGPNTLKRRQCR